MKKTILSAGILALSISASAQSSTLTFDDIHIPNPFTPVVQMTSYSGFNFNNLFAANVALAPAYKSARYGAHSGNNALVNNNKGTGVITSQSDLDFTFDGLWAKKWGTSQESGGAYDLSGTISGWKDGLEIWSINTALNGSYKSYGAQMGAIDTLNLSLGDFFLVDDLELNTVVSAVPVPTAAFLFAPALLGFLGLRRKAKNSVA